MSKKFFQSSIVLFVLGAVLQFGSPVVVAVPVDIDILNLPPGPYHDSCRSCWQVLKDDDPHQVTPYLRCFCRDMEKGHETEMEATLPLPCRGEIDNILGKLVCK